VTRINGGIDFERGETLEFTPDNNLVRSEDDEEYQSNDKQIFLPESELQFSLDTRNTRRIDFALYRIDLTRDVRFTKNLEEDEGDGEVDSWITRLPISVHPTPPVASPPVAAALPWRDPLLSLRAERQRGRQAPPPSPR